MRNVCLTVFDDPLADHFGVYRDLWLPVSLSDSAAFHQMLSMVALHFRRLRQRSDRLAEKDNCRDIFLHHGMAIRSVNRRISKAILDIDDGVIAAVVGFACHSVRIVLRVRTVQAADLAVSASCRRLLRMANPYGWFSKAHPTTRWNVEGSWIEHTSAAADLFVSHLFLLPPTPLYLALAMAMAMAMLTIHQCRSRRFLCTRPPTLLSSSRPRRPAIHSIHGSQFRCRFSIRLLFHRLDPSR